MYLHELLHNDYTAIFRIDGNSQYNLDRFYVEKTIANNTLGHAYYIDRMLSFGDYDSSSDVERSNVRMFLKDFKDNKFVRHIKGAYSSEMIAIDILCDDQEIIDTISSLAGYPALDDEDVSRINMEMEDENWDSWIKRDLVNAIVKKFDADDSDPDYDKLKELYHELKDKSNEYFIVEAGGSGYISVAALVDKIETAPECMKLEFDDYSFAEDIIERYGDKLHTILYDKTHLLGFIKDSRRAQYFYKVNDDMSFHFDLLSHCNAEATQWFTDELIRYNYVIGHAETTTTYYDILLRKEQ